MQWHKVSVICDHAACVSPVAQIRKAPRDMQLQITAKNTTKVGERFSVAFLMWPVAQRTVVNATFTGSIPPTLRATEISQSISNGEVVCKCPQLAMSFSKSHANIPLH
jgi:hypothetical protein